MAANAFISFDHDDQRQFSGFRLLKNNPKHPLDFRDHSLKDPVRDQKGRPINYSPSDPRSAPVRAEIVKKFDCASRLVVLIGEDTHTSEWVDWEIMKFYEMKRSISGDKTWKRIRGMTLKDLDNAIIPPALMNGRSTQWLAWNPVALDVWLDQDPNA